jgi:hypothetical protein
MDEIIIRRCDRATMGKQGYVIMCEDGRRIYAPNEDVAHIIYVGINGKKSLSVYDGGYLIPLLCEE